MIEIYDFFNKMEGIQGIKISFEDEGLMDFQAQKMASETFKAGYPLTVKIGGCEAKRDLRAVYFLGAQSIVAPMIESVYALEKYIAATKEVFGNDFSKVSLFINIETITAFHCLKKISDSASARFLAGIVFGRSDFAASLEKDKAFVNSEDMLEYVLHTAELCRKNDKKFYIGGNVDTNSLVFFEKVAQTRLDGFETRNVIFHADVLNDKKRADFLINQALDFEKAWLCDKNKAYKTMFEQDGLRISLIQKKLT